jgi:protein O-GlcNAc transferase
MNSDFNEAIHSAFKEYQTGNLQQAENICKNLLKNHPDNAEALYLLGIIYFQRGDYDSAINYIQRTLKFNNNADAYHILGLSFQQKRQLDKAIRYYRKAVQLNPYCSEAFFNLGLIFHDRGQVDDAIANYERYLQLNPGDAEIFLNIGHALQLKGDVDKAIVYYQKALHIKPNYIEAYNNLGTIFQTLEQFDEAISCYQKTIQFKEDYAEGYYNLGNVLKKQGKLLKALDYYRLALQRDSNSAKTYNNLGILMKDLGKLNEAEDCFKRALEITSNCPSYYSNYLCLLNYMPQYGSKAIFSEHLKFATHYAEQSVPVDSKLMNKHIANRKLKIGYISPDFKNHPVANFIEPVLAEHDRNLFEIFGYSSFSIQDEVTERLRHYMDHWMCIADMSDEKAAELIRKDRIDILVDLAGHTAHNRILLFARKPAPIQVTWIGYPATTGLSTIDYKIVDNYTDPPGTTEQFYSEELMRIPESFLCYLPDKETPDIGGLPALALGRITFGTSNNFSKVTPEVIALWARILKKVPDSKLIIKGKIFFDKNVCPYVLDLFKEENISYERIELLSWRLLKKEHLDIYNRIDIGLDTFPYNGTTTTCEALWMGVPVITLAGETHASRVGMSILSNVGIPEFIAKSPDEYVEIAAKLAEDLDRLQSLRERLRNMMSHSPLMNKTHFTSNLENSYRTMWKKWCTSANL